MYYVQNVMDRIQHRCVAGRETQAVRDREQPVVINEGGYEARRQSRIRQIDAEDPCLIEIVMALDRAGSTDR